MVKQAEAIIMRQVFNKGYSRLGGSINSKRIDTEWEGECGENKIRVEFDLTPKGYTTDEEGNKVSRITITDMGNEDNFAVMYPKHGNMRSLGVCLAKCLTEVEEHF